jgi:hypothetical protein
MRRNEPHPPCCTAASLELCCSACGRRSRECGLGGCGTARCEPEARSLRSVKFTPFQGGLTTMPEKTTLERAKRDRRSGKAPSTQAGEFVREEIHHIREGKHGARSTEQAIAIGLAKARRAGIRLKPPRKGSVSRRTRRNAELASEAGSHLRRTRSRAIEAALKREGHGAASHKALSEQAHRSASKRTHAQRSAAARRAARTKGARRRSAAARKAARTRRANAAQPAG